MLDVKDIKRLTKPAGLFASAQEGEWQTAVRANRRSSTASRWSTCRYPAAGGSRRGGPVALANSVLQIKGLHCARGF